MLQVDVFLPRYKEPWALYGPVVQSALDINYPPEKLTVYVLDDGRSDPVKQDLQVSLRMRLTCSCSAMPFMRSSHKTHDQDLQAGTLTLVCMYSMTSSHP